MTPTVLQVGTKALIANKEGKYLFLQRSESLSTDGSENIWDIPGGRINNDEALIDALKREISEETHLEINDQVRVVASQDIFVPHKNLHVVRLTYIAVATTQEVTLSDEHIAYKWLSIDEALAVNLDPYIVDVLNDIKRSENL
jgi:8-oxo-dGTP diphosphatase